MTDTNFDKSLGERALQFARNWIDSLATVDSAVVVELEAELRAVADERAGNTAATILCKVVDVLHGKIPPMALEPCIDEVCDVLAEHGDLALERRELEARIDQHKQDCSCTFVMLADETYGCPVIAALEAELKKAKGGDAK